MEWVETTAKTVDEAKELALDQLGVDELDAEFEVLEEPKPGLFGRMRGQARVRARVEPRRPPAKDERRRKGRRRGGADAERPREAKPATSAAAVAAEDATPVDTGDADDSGSDRGARPERSGGRDGGARPRRRGGSGGQQRGSGAETSSATGGSAAAGRPAQTKGPDDMTGLTLDEQGAIVRGFLDGLLEAYGIEGTVESERIDDEMLELRVSGEEVGVLIGQRGKTMQAMQEVARSVVQRQGGGHHEGRFRIDVGGYRQKRREALERFTQQVADKVKETGEAAALEPMGPADRKVVHDTVNEIDGVSTTSRGEDSDRHVVILPDEG